MCGQVRGVGAGGVISTAFCVLYKLFTFRITRKQLVSMINSTQSVFIRGVGFLYIRFCQPPTDLLAWMEPYIVSVLYQDGLFVCAFRMTLKRSILARVVGTTKQSDRCLKRCCWNSTGMVHCFHVFHSLFRLTLVSYSINSINLEGNRIQVWRQASASWSTFVW